MFTIRTFHPQDQLVVNKLILQGLAEHFGRINPNLNPDLNDIQATYLEPGHTFVVAEAGEQIVGTAALIHEAPQIGRIVRVTVHPDHRRAGLGRLLVEQLLKTAVEKRLRQVLVETNLDWYGAIRLYQRCGFVEYDRDTESVHFSLTL